MSRMTAEACFVIGQTSILAGSSWSSRCSADLDCFWMCFLKARGVMSAVCLNVRRTERPKTCNHTTCPPALPAGFCSCPTAEAVVRLGKNRFYGRLSAVFPSSPVSAPTTKEETLRTLKCFFWSIQSRGPRQGPNPLHPNPLSWRSPCPPPSPRLSGLWSGLQRWQPWVWVQRVSAGAVYVERLKGLYRSTSTHAFCMRKTLSKRRLAWKKKKKIRTSGGRVLENMLNSVKNLNAGSYVCKLALIYRIVRELLSTLDMTRFSFLPCSLPSSPSSPTPSSPPPFLAVEVATLKSEWGKNKAPPLKKNKKTKTGSLRLSNGGSESVGEFSSRVWII